MKIKQYFCGAFRKSVTGYGLWVTGYGLRVTESVLNSIKKGRKTFV